MVEGDWQTPHQFYRDNARLREELGELEERARRRDMLIGDEEIAALYEARIPADIISVRHFDGWWRKQRRHTPDLLTFTRDDLLRRNVAWESDNWQPGDVALPLTYRYEPGADDDGVTVHIPVEVLARLGGDEFSWQVPALREELITALIKSLPKDLRRNFVPAPDTARIVPRRSRRVGALLNALQRERAAAPVCWCRSMRSTSTSYPRICASASPSSPPMGNVVGRGRTCRFCRRSLRNPPARRWWRRWARTSSGQRRAAGRTTCRNCRAWSRARCRALLAAIPSADTRHSWIPVRQWTFKCSPRNPEQAAATGSGLAPAAAIGSPPVRAIEKALDPRTRLLLGANPDGSLTALVEDCADAAIDALLPVSGVGRLRVRRRPRQSRSDAGATAREILGRVEKVLAVLQQVQVALPGEAARRHADAVADIEAQLEWLLPKGFVVHRCDAPGRPDLLPTAIVRRLEKLPQGLVGDRERMNRVLAVQDAYDELLKALPPSRAVAPDVVDIGR